jgi:hypothetical protein
MAARGVESPDRADAICGAYYQPTYGAITKQVLSGIYLPSGGFEHESVSFDNEPPEGFFG